MIKQKTIKKEIKISGLGLHSGKMVNLTLKPANENTGIIYIRTDLIPNVIFKNNPYNVLNTELCTSLTVENYEINTIEHLNSTLYALGISNLIIELDSYEIPIMDGSASPFVFSILEVGILIQNENQKFIKIKEDFLFKQDDKWIKASPSPFMSFGVTIDFNNAFVKNTNQNINFKLTPETYIRMISNARTFCFLKEIKYLKSKNLCLGGSLDNAIVVDEFNILNENLRHKDEFVKHKLLDLIGDLYLSGMPIIGHIECYKPGHKLNNLFLKSLLESSKKYEIITINKEEIIEKEIKQTEKEENFAPVL